MAILDKARIRAFEIAWWSGEDPKLELFLPDQEDALYLATLEELIAIDVEFAWRAWADQEDSTQQVPTGIENYIQRFDLQSDSDVVWRLIESEIDIRRRLGVKTDLDDYLQRLPKLARERVRLERLLRRDLTAAHPLRTVDLATTCDVSQIAQYSIRQDGGTIVPRVGHREEPAINSAFRLGVALDGRYVLKRELGRGGMGVVYLGSDSRLGRTVAIKAILGLHDAHGQRRSSNAEKLFANEAKLGASLQHPAISAVYDYGFHDGVPYTVFEFVPGSTLRKVIREQAPMPVEDVQRIVSTLAHALDYAHKRQVVHRDLKPENVMASKDGQYKILDLGLAKRFDRPDSDWSFAGTPLYASPEQASEIPSDGRTDQYALALIAYELLTGKRPFQVRDGHAVLECHRNQVPDSPQKWCPGLPSQVSDAILRALAKNPNHRFSSCESFASALGARMVTSVSSNPNIVFEAEARTPRRPFSMPWSRSDRRVYVVLTSNEL